MPSVDDIAQCANYAGKMQGCDGGNPAGVWNNWMTKLNRPIWVMGEKCKPYTMKCKSTGGVVNPINAGTCSAYKDYADWHKPCNCIPESIRPKSFQCPSDAPKASCGFPVPAAFFTVSGVSHGLSIADSVLNMQRHIAEFGPIYVSFATTHAFMKNDWAKNPVYTGGSSVEGGHAVTAVGWGTHQGTDYWLLRNSWGGDWAEKGYGKFARGKNLDGIENSCAASMPTSDFKDWSAPVCRLKTWGYAYMATAGGKLTSYTLTPAIQCNKACTLKIFTSALLTSRKQIETGVSGSDFNAKITSGQANKAVDMKAVEMTHLKFGPKAGDMWFKITATDASGNTAKTTHFVNIPTAPW